MQAALRTLQNNIIIKLSVVCKKKFGAKMSEELVKI